jgi:hypothetical protein
MEGAGKTECLGDDLTDCLRKVPVVCPDLGAPAGRPAVYETTPAGRQRSQDSFAGLFRQLLPQMRAHRLAFGEAIEVEFFVR